MEGLNLNNFVVYADGSVSADNGGPNADGGIGWYVEGLCFGYGYVPPKCTNNISEMLAVMAGVSHLVYKHGANSVQFVSDSSYTVNGFMEWLDGWHRKNYHDVKNDGLWRKAYLLKRKVHLIGKHVRGHGKAKEKEHVWPNSIVDHLAHFGRVSQRNRVVYIDDKVKNVLSCHHDFYVVRQEAKARKELFNLLEEIEENGTV